MNDLKRAVSNSSQPILVYDQKDLKKEDLLLPFALTDVFTQFSGMHQQPMIHFWQLPHTMILGMKDTRVADLTKGLASLKEAHYTAIIRNSGGLGVISDCGVLNVSLILPNNETQKITIDTAYRLMWHWIKATFEDDIHRIEAFEVTDSYCPGAFDLSINGKKFAGIAQRRVKKGIAVMLYLSVNGDQEKRGQVVRRFYQKSLGTAFGTNGYPAVNPSVMATLEELLDRPLLVSEVKKKLVTQFVHLSSKSFTNITQDFFSRSLCFSDELTHQLEKMKQRNQTI